MNDDAHVERISEIHDFSDFDCGTKSLNDWLVNHALENDSRGLSRVFVLVDDTSDCGRPIGYVSLTMASVTKEQLPSKLGRGLPPVEIGAALIGRLAIVREYAGRGLGRDLLVFAMDRALQASEAVAGRFIAVDPIDHSARAFYLHHGFRDVPGDEGGRMFMRISEAHDPF